MHDSRKPAILAALGAFLITGAFLPKAASYGIYDAFPPLNWLLNAIDRRAGWDIAVMAALGVYLVARAVTLLVRRQEGPLHSVAPLRPKEPTVRTFEARSVQGP